jgi:hypothetical protein
VDTDFLPLDLQSVRRRSMCFDNSAMAAEAPVEFWTDMKPKLGMIEDARARIPPDVATPSEE